MRKRGRVLVALGAAWALAVAIQLSALARAGGGGGGGGHGGGGSGGGGHSSGGGGGVFFVGGGGSGSSSGGSPLLFFIILALIGAFLIYRALSSRKSGGSGTSRDATLAPGAGVDAAAVQSGVAALQARDPNFNPQVFIDRAQTTFFVLQNAWMARNLEPARIYLSDAIYHRWKLQVEQFVALHKRDVLEDLAVNGCALAKVGSDANFDSVTVR
ncbi:MAG TPA: TIM44-like domain-containing protein, partial [Candidatus Dormibacteraeota bacterium]|nr:TIM44-like domain-containing protein [Candidatus Dormibacteraeota bacterium]